jgi:plastocyanin
VWNISFSRLAVGACWIGGACSLAGYPVVAQEEAVTAQVKIERPASTKQAKAPIAARDASQVVVWLSPLNHPGTAGSESEHSDKKLQVVQKNKSFQPHLTVVRVGSVVDFPNRDPFFHNVFSLFDGKRFDLGLYEAGATNSVRFDHPGVSFLFCNIHPEMSAVVIALDTPYYAVTDKSGGLAIPNVPDGKYDVHVWYERSLPEELKGLLRIVRISSDSRNLGTIVVPEDAGFSPSHKNKYGQDYPPPPKQGYPHP